MVKKNKRRVIASIIVVIFLVIAFFGGRYFIFTKIRHTVLAQMDSLRLKGYTVSFDSLDASSFHNRISISNLAIRFPVAAGICNDSASTARCRKLEVGGIRILPLIFGKIKLGIISIERPQLHYFKKNNSPTKSEKAKSRLQEISVDQVVVASACLDLSDSVACVPRMIVQADLDLSGLLIKNPGQETIEGLFEKAVARNIKVKYPLDFYTISLHQIEWNNAERSIVTDSIKIKPDYNKSIFAQKTGHQTDRIDCVFPAARLSGVDITLTNKPSITVKNIATAFDLEVFHDKRYPNAKPTIKELPSRSIHSIGIPLQIDTILVSHSSVTYEEFPEGGNVAGVVSFNDLSFKIGNCSNTSTNPMKMTASSRFMNAGDLQASFTFPSDPVKPYTIEGSVKDLNLPEINKILVPIAHVEVKEGHLKEMAFDFTYNEFRSDGSLTMNYNKLDVSLLKNGKNNDENKFLTLIARAFVQKNMDKDKKGKILFYHDSAHSTFNYWWKSILSGIKSLYKLDKVTDTHHSKKK